MKPTAPRAQPWPLRATALAARVPIAALHPAVVAAIRARPLGETLAIACSGGADSVALTLLLWAHFPERRGRWLLLHFNHKLRAQASDTDAAFARALARGLGERCRVGAWRHPRPSATDAGAAAEPVSEASARGARWRFLDDAARAAGARVIATGHQADDAAETMLMRLARGSGAAGLAAPRPVQSMGDSPSRVRPLLPLSAVALRAALRAVGAPWREDATNATDTFLRNRVRHRVLPALTRACGRAAPEGFAAARAQLEEDDDALAHWLRELLSPDVVRIWAAGATADLSALRGRPRALARRAVFAWLSSAGLGAALARAAVEGLIDAVVTGATTRLSVGRDQFIICTRGLLSIARETSAVENIPRWSAMLMPQRGVLRGPSGDRLSARTITVTATLRRRIIAGAFPPTERVFLDASALAGRGLAVRAWQAGDRYRPLGAPGRAKLQDLFTDRKIPRELRQRLPVVTLADGAPIWVPGLPPAAELALHASTKQVVQLTYLPPEATVPRLKKTIPRHG